MQRRIRQAQTTSPAGVSSTGQQTVCGNSAFLGTSGQLVFAVPPAGLLIGMFLCLQLFLPDYHGVRHSALHKPKLFLMPRRPAPGPYVCGPPCRQAGTEHHTFPLCRSALLQFPSLCNANCTCFCSFSFVSFFFTRDLNSRKYILTQRWVGVMSAGAAITIPESLQWVQLPANNDIIPLKRLFEAASERSNVQAQVEVAATLRRCLSNPECLR